MKAKAPSASMLTSSTKPPPPEGVRVTASAEVTKVDGLRIDFRIEATDGAQVIGTGTHERRVINLGQVLGAAEEERRLGAVSEPCALTIHDRTA